MLCSSDAWTWMVAPNYSQLLSMIADVDAQVMLRLFSNACMLCLVDAWLMLGLGCLDLDAWTWMLG
jgi:hypothetical protein